MGHVGRDRPGHVRDLRGFSMAQPNDAACGASCCSWAPGRRPGRILAFRGGKIVHGEDGALPRRTVGSDAPMEARESSDPRAPGSDRERT